MDIGDSLLFFPSSQKTYDRTRKTKKRRGTASPVSTVLQHREKKKKEGEEEKRYDFHRILMKRGGRNK